MVTTRLPGLRLAAALAALGLASTACLSEDSGDDSGDTDEGRGPGGSITVMKALDLDGEEWFPPFIEEFEEQTGITVNLQQMITPDLNNALELAFQSGDVPDVMQIEGTSDRMRLYYSQGVLAPLDEYLTDEFTSQFAPDTFDSATPGLHIDGVLYSIPFRANASVPEVRLLWYLPDVLAQYGFDAPPATWGEFAKIATTIQAESDGEVYGSGMIMGRGGTSEYQMTAGVPSISLYGVDFTTGRAALSDPSLQEAVEFRRELIEDGGVIPGWETAAPADMSQAMAQEQIAMHIGVPHLGPNILNINPDLELAAAPLPVPDSGRGGKTPLIDAHSPSWAIGADSENKEAAWQFIEYMSSVEFQRSYYEKYGFVLANEQAMDGHLTELGEQLVQIAAETTTLMPNPAAESDELAQLMSGLAERFTNPWQDPVEAYLVSGGDFDSAVAAMEQEIQDYLDTEIAELGLPDDALAYPDWDPSG